MEQSALVLFQLREMYKKDPEYAGLCNALSLAGDLLVELDRSCQREPDYIGVQDSLDASQNVELVWEGVNPPSKAVRRDFIKIYNCDRVDFTVYHDDSMTAFFSESFEGFIQLIQEMRDEELSSLTLHEYMN